ncbi:DUF167 domain-containing protein [Flindersiella endophytica]
MRIPIRVKPGARRAGVGGRYDGPLGAAIVVAVTAPAVDGRATEAALRAVAEAFGVRPRQVTLVSGERSRDKLVQVSGTTSSDVARLEQRLRVLLADGA